MRFLTGTFGVAFGLLAALLYWWRPAPALISVKPVDWATAYEQAHIPGNHPPGTLPMGRQGIQAMGPHLPLTNFIQLITKGRLRSMSGTPWRKWAASHRAGKDATAGPSGFLRPGDPLAVGLSPPWGYIEIHGRDHIDLLGYRWLNTTELAGKGIPSGLHFPYRPGAILILVTTLVLAASAGLRPVTDPRVPDCTAGKGCKVFAVILCIGAALILLPFLYRLGDNTLLLTLIGGFIALCGFIGLAMFGGQAVRVADMLKGKNVLARWSCAPDEWQRFTTWAYATEKAQKRVLLWVLTAVILGAGGGFCLLMQDEAALWVLLFLSGIVILTWLIVLMHRWLSCRRDSRGPGEVVVGPSALYIDGSVHSWSMAGSRIESAQFATKPFPMLEIIYSYILKPGHFFYLFRQRTTVHIPVPKERQGDAAAIAETLMSRKRR
jgi:hypothetical protein